MVFFHFSKQSAMKKIATVLSILTIIWLAPNCQSNSSDDKEETTEQEGKGQCVPFPNSRYGTCANLEGDTSILCSYLPRDVDFESETGYSGFDSFCQRPFDWFSWQTFVALNWPADSEGNPLPGNIGSAPDAPRVWDAYFNLDEVFNPGYTKSGELRTFTSITKAVHFKGMIDDIEAATPYPVIDRNLNFALFEVRVNDVEKNYIQGNDLTTYCGQKKFEGRINFPEGFYPDSIGAIEIKAGWRVLLPGVDDFSRYHVQKAIVEVPASGVVGGKKILDTVQVGLVALHIFRQVKTEPNGGVWTSFEQVDDAPTCPAGKCPQDIPAGKYSFHNADFPTDTMLNVPPDQGEDPSYLWSQAKDKNNPQYARRYATYGKYGTQVGRIHPVESSTQTINKMWQQKLKGTVWENYKLIASQWFDEERSGHPQPVVGIPKYAANTIAETYFQPKGSCMTCHGFAETSTKEWADYSFVLSIPDSTGCD